MPYSIIGQQLLSHMRLSKLKRLVSTLGASIVVGVGSSGVVASVPETKTVESSYRNRSSQKTAVANTVSTSVDSASEEGPSPQTTVKATNLKAQRETLAENPLCKLASEMMENPPEVFQSNPVSQPPSRFSNLVAGFLTKTMQVMGLERLVEAEPIPTTTVAVVPKSGMLQDEAIATDPGNEAPASTTALVSNTTSAPRTAAGEYELWVKGHLIANVRTESKANLLAQRLERLVETDSFNGAAVTPMLHQEQPAIAMGEQILFVIDESVTREASKNYEILAIRWANNLRLAFDVPALDLVTAQTNMYQVKETSQSMEGLASWYGPYFHGRLTANGEIYDQFALTAAHPSMPLNTFLKITNLNNEKSVIIRLNDRGPYIKPRNLDLSLGAARCLNSVDKGVIPYKATIMERRPAIAAEAI